MKQRSLIASTTIVVDVQLMQQRVTIPLLSAQFNPRVGHTRLVWECLRTFVIEYSYGSLSNCFKIQEKTFTVSGLTDANTSTVVKHLVIVVLVLTIYHQYSCILEFQLMSTFVTLTVDLW